MFFPFCPLFSCERSEKKDAREQREHEHHCVCLSARAHVCIHVCVCACDYGSAAPPCVCASVCLLRMLCSFRSSVLCPGGSRGGGGPHEGRQAAGRQRKRSHPYSSRWTCTC